MTHQLIGNILDAFGRQLEQVRITEVRDNIFYAELILDHHTRISARVGDAIALALPLGVPIHAEDIVLDTAAGRQGGRAVARPDLAELLRRHSRNAAEQRARTPCARPVTRGSWATLRVAVGTTG
jgi:hypothetical protein